MSREGAPQERVPVALDNVENFSDWQKLRDSAPVEVARIISEISDLPRQEKIKAIIDMISELNEDDGKRYVIEGLAHQVAILEEEVRNRQRLVELGVV